MKPIHLIKKYKTQSEIARQFGFTRAAVSLWCKANAIPLRSQMVIAFQDRDFVADKKGLK